MDGQKFCLKWDGFQSNVTSLFDELRRDDELTDVLLCCGEGSQLPAHRMMLSACSPYFRELLKNNRCQQMIIFLKDTSLLDLNAIIEFIYKGSVNVAQSQLASFIKTAEMLQIRGLSGDEEKVPPPTPTPPVTRPPQPPPPEPRPPPPPPPPQTPPAKRFRSAEAEAIAQNARAILAGGLHHLGTPGRKVARIPVQPHQQLQSMTSQLPASPAVLSGSSDHSAASPPASVKEGREAEDGGAGEEEGEKPEQKYGVEAAQNIKVETLDLTDDDVSLVSTLERVNNFEGGFQAEDAGHQSGDANEDGKDLEATSSTKGPRTDQNDQEGHSYRPPRSSTPLRSGESPQPLPTSPVKDAKAEASDLPLHENLQKPSTVTCASETEDTTAPSSAEGSTGESTRKELHTPVDMRTPSSPDPDPQLADVTEHAAEGVVHTNEDHHRPNQGPERKTFPSGEKQDAEHSQDVAGTPAVSSNTPESPTKTAEDTAESKETEFLESREDILETPYLSDDHKKTAEDESSGKKPTEVAGEPLAAPSPPSGGPSVVASSPQFACSETPQSPSPEDSSAEETFDGLAAEGEMSATLSEPEEVGESPFESRIFGSDESSSHPTGERSEVIEPSLGKELIAVDQAPLSPTKIQESQVEENTREPEVGAKTAEPAEPEDQSADQCDPGAGSLVSAPSSALQDSLHGSLAVSVASSEKSAEEVPMDELEAPAKEDNTIGSSGTVLGVEIEETGVPAKEDNTRVSSGIGIEEDGGSESSRPDTEVQGQMTEELAADAAVCEGSSGSVEDTEMVSADKNTGLVQDSGSLSAQLTSTSPNPCRECAEVDAGKATDRNATDPMTSPIDSSPLAAEVESSIKIKSKRSHLSSESSYVPEKKSRKEAEDSAVPMETDPAASIGKTDQTPGSGVSLPKRLDQEEADACGGDSVGGKQECVEAEVCDYGGGQRDAWEPENAEPVPEKTGSSAPAEKKLDQEPLKVSVSGPVEAGAEKIKSEGEAERDQLRELVSKNVVSQSDEPTKVDKPNAEPAPKRKKMKPSRKPRNKEVPPSTDPSRDVIKSSVSSRVITLDVTRKTSQDETSLRPDKAARISFEGSGDVLVQKSSEKPSKKQTKHSIRNSAETEYAKRSEKDSSKASDRASDTSRSSNPDRPKEKATGSSRKVVDGGKTHAKRLEKAGESSLSRPRSRSKERLSGKSAEKQKEQLSEEERLKKKRRKSSKGSERGRSPTPSEEKHSKHHGRHDKKSKDKDKEKKKHTKEHNIRSIKDKSKDRSDRVSSALSTGESSIKSSRQSSVERSLKSSSMASSRRSSVDRGLASRTDESSRDDTDALCDKLRKNLMTEFNRIEDGEVDSKEVPKPAEVKDKEAGVETKELASLVEGGSCDDPVKGQDEGACAETCSVVTSGITTSAVTEEPSSDAGTSIQQSTEKEVADSGETTDSRKKEPDETSTIVGTAEPGPHSSPGPDAKHLSQEMQQSKGEALKLAEGRSETSGQEMEEAAIQEPSAIKSHQDTVNPVSAVQSTSDPSLKKDDTLQTGTDSSDICSTTAEATVSTPRLSEDPSRTFQASADASRSQDPSDPSQPTALASGTTSRSEPSMVQIWKGRLEWTENEVGLSTRRVHSLPCSMSCGAEVPSHRSDPAVKDTGEGQTTATSTGSLSNAESMELSTASTAEGGENGGRVSLAPLISAANWPTKMVMQLVNKTVVDTIDEVFFKEGIPVSFSLAACSGSYRLGQVWSAASVGCVLFKTSGKEVRALIMMTKDGGDGAFSGFMPTDQTGFVAKLKVALARQKQILARKMQQKTPTS